MTPVRGRWLLVVAGAVALLTALPCGAVVRPVPPQADDAAEASALHLLQAAAWNSLVRPWTAVQRVLSLQAGLPRLAAMQVDHVPGRGSSMVLMAADERMVSSDAQDADLLNVLVGHYDVAFAGQAVVDGRRATLLEARRPGVTGPGAVAGRFWLDRDSGMVVRRDVLDETGALVRSTTFDLISVGAVSRAAAKSTGPHLDQAWLESVRADGWPVPARLSPGFDLYDARMHDHVLQLAYSDGLSTASLFVQPGELSREPAGTARPLDDGGTVWVTSGSPERMVWSGDGHTWTLLSDAPASTVAEAVRELPHTPAPVPDGPATRIWRGMAVVGGWLNPFE